MQNQSLTRAAWSVWIIQYQKYVSTETDSHSYDS